MAQKNFEFARRSNVDSLGFVALEGFMGLPGQRRAEGQNGDVQNDKNKFEAD